MNSETRYPNNQKVPMPSGLKTIGSSGQLSFGKKNAGKTVTVEEIDDGVWIVKTAKVIPDDELWLHESPFKERLDKAIQWAENTPPQASDLDELERKLKARR
jgi:hypothetical protein